MCFSGKCVQLCRVEVQFRFLGYYINFICYEIFLSQTFCMQQYDKCEFKHFQARDDYLRPQKIREEYDDTYTSVLGLRFEISRHHFRQGVIRLKCSSSLLTIYWQSSMVSTKLLVVSQSVIFFNLSKIILIQNL